MNDDVDAALERLFSADSSIYQERGFQRRVGFGERPALVNIDLANAWTRPGNPFSCDGMDVIIPGVQRLLEAARAKGIPVVYTTTAYAVTEGPNSDMGIWNRKIPLEALAARLRRRRDRRAHRAGAGRARHRQEARQRLPRHAPLELPHGARVDTVIVTGVTMAGCVRHTVEDAIAEGFRPIVVRECVGDRVPGVVEWNLFDIDAKFGDVEPLERVLDYLDGVTTWQEAQPATAAGG